MSEDTHTSTAGETPEVPGTKSRNLDSKINPSAPSLESLQAENTFLNEENTRLFKDLKKADAEIIKLKAGLSKSRTKAVKNTDTVIWTSRETGEKYTFTRHTPPRFNHLGKNKTQQEWAEDDEAMLALINGRSSFVKPYKDNKNARKQ
jgi:hypothetical protein